MIWAYEGSMKDTLTYGENLHLMMSQRGLNQAELTKRTGIPQGSISRYARDLITPSVYASEKIRRSMFIPADEFYKRIKEE